MEWIVERVRGSAAQFHGRDLPGDGAAHVWMFDVTAPAVALGSAQPAGHLSAAACARAGVEVVRRRSGGGAVLLLPGEIVWVDVVIPPGHPRWDDDVSRAGWWIGEAWAAALIPDLPGGEVHRGPMVVNEWSPMVCFAGLGAGEVSVAGHKVMGLSQRRSRAGARFQTAVHRRWDPVFLHGLLASPPGPPSTMPEVVSVPTPADVLMERFLTNLGASGG